VRAAGAVTAADGGGGGGGGGPVSSDDVANNSSVPGATVTDALNALLAAGSRYALQFSDTGNRAAGASLRSGGDLFGNLTPGSGAGQPSGGGVVREVAWRRSVAILGSFRISAIQPGGTERAFILVPTPNGVGDGIASGLNFPINPGEQIAVLWDISSSGTTQNPAVTVLVEP